MRAHRFYPYIVALVEEHLSDTGVKSLGWAESGMADGESAHTQGLVLQAPSGGTAYMQFVHGVYRMTGDSYENPEKVVEGEPPAPVPPVELRVTPDGQLRMADLEEWIVTLLINSGNPEMKSVERYSTRERDPQKDSHPFGFTVHWHSGDRAFGHLVYTLRPGQKRSADVEWKILEAV